MILIILHSCCRDKFYSYSAKKDDYQFETIDQYIIRNFPNIDSNYIKKTFTDYTVHTICSDSIFISNKTVDKVFRSNTFIITKNSNKYYYSNEGKLQVFEYYYAGRLQKRYIRKGRKMVRDYFIIITPPM